MIGGVSWVWWLGFHLVVAAFLAIDALLPFGKKSDRLPLWVAWVSTSVIVTAAVVFACWIAVTRGHTTAFEFAAGYAIETSLSVDNLFVFLAIFRCFGLSQRRERKALTYGVGGAIVLRAIFIGVGVTLLQRFDWISYLFGAILLYAAWGLARGSSEQAPAWVARLSTRGGSLLPVILAVEVTDLIFAFDSVPAVLAITRDPFVAYTSNIAAILGLRSMYTVLSSLLDRLRYLHYGLAALLAFVAFKMMAARWIEISVTLSLAIFGAILGLCAVISWIAGPAPDSK
jgi:tellurite resistance protein TerC